MRMIVEKKVRLRTECQRILFAGFFGINENGDQPECDAMIEVDADEYEQDADGTVRPTFSVRCDKCGGLLEWPHAWEIVTRSEGGDETVFLEENDHEEDR